MTCSIVIADLAKCTDSHVALSWARSYHRPERPTGTINLSFVAASTGGILRDVLIGAIPPATLVDWRYLAISMLAGIVTFYWFPVIDRLRSPVQLFDAAGLALFAGYRRAESVDLWPRSPLAALLGMLTGIGGGMARDLLLREIPTVRFARGEPLSRLASPQGETANA